MTTPRMKQASGLKATTADRRAAHPQLKTVSAEKPQRTQPIAPANAGEGLAGFVELEIEARKCETIDDLRFAIVNGPRRLAAFDQAFLAEPSASGTWSISRASSVAKVDRHTPYLRGLEAWLNHAEHAELLARCEPRQAQIAQETAEWGIRSKAFDLPYALWIPIKRRDGSLLAGLIALKRDNWRPQHTMLMMPLADMYGHSWEALGTRRIDLTAALRPRFKARRMGLLVSATLAVAAFLPVPMSALAPAEIVGADAALITAPLDGVIHDVALPPGASVRKGDVLVRFVDVKLRNDLEVAKRNRAVADSKYFRVIQSATSAQKDMQDIALAKSEVDVATAEMTSAEELLARSVVRAPRDGILVYTSKSDWIGKPVATGERIMEVADPANTEIRIELPVSDAMAIKPGGTVALFLDGSPLTALPGSVTRTSFRPVMSAEQQLAFRLYARFERPDMHRVGLRGVARVSADDVPLWFYLFRRPISAMRQRFGL